MGIKSASCSNYSAPTATRRAESTTTTSTAARSPPLAFGDPSFIGIARPIDANDRNLAATWRKDARGHISVRNETGGYLG